MLFRSMTKTDSVSSSPANILLVDDNATEAQLASELIERHESSPEVTWANSGRKALELLQEAESGLYKLVLLDIKMPGMDGLQTLKEIRELDLGWYVPIVMFSNSSLKADIEQSYILGANAYIQKEMDFHVQEKAMKSILDFWLLCNVEC